MDSISDVPLCVDLDGTLIRTDLLLESVAGLLVKNALLVFMLPLWFFMGIARMKAEIAARVDLDAARFPYNKKFLGYLTNQKKKGRTLILTTASNEKYAHQVSGFLKIFDEVIASNGTVNCSGVRKRDILLKRYGANGFDYAGNNKTDLYVWELARQAILIDNDSGLRQYLNQLKPDSIVFHDSREQFTDYLSILRIHHWTKNLLLFVPLITAHRVAEFDLIFETLVGFLSFCLCTSTIYIFNDFCDISTDRKLHTKKGRSFASGNLPIGRTLILAVILLFSGLALSLFLVPTFTGILLVYIFFTVAYSVYIKSIRLLDVLCLAVLYTLRIEAGGAASQVDVSLWLITFSLFLFLSLAILKRYSEILATPSNALRSIPGRGYNTSDKYYLQKIGGSAAITSILVLVFYINSHWVKQLYNYPTLIWLLLPLFSCWIARTWILASRGLVHDDPVMYTILDPMSYLLGCAILTTIWLAA